jgi:multidrug efflux pump subunit AcrB
MSYKLQMKKLVLEASDNPKQLNKVFNTLIKNNEALREELRFRNEMIHLHESDDNNTEKELDSVRKLNIMLMKFMKEIQTEQNLAEMTGLDKDTGTDVAIVHIAQDYKELKEENEKLKEENKKLKEEVKQVYLDYF